jgi:hypothetical protein
MKWIVLLLITIAGCGASTAQVTAAKTAAYRAPGGEILDLALQAARENYKIGDVDASAKRFVTAMQFYTPEGGRQSAGAEGVTMVGGGSVGVQLLVEVHEQGEIVRVSVTPKTMQVVSGSPQPRELKPDDPNLPPWVHGRVDALYVAIHSRAKRFTTTTEVRQGPPSAPQME